VNDVGLGPVAEKILQRLKTSFKDVIALIVSPNIVECRCTLTILSRLTGMSLGARRQRSRFGFSVTPLPHSHAPRIIALDPIRLTMVTSSRQRQGIRAQLAVSAGFTRSTREGEGIRSGGFASGVR